MLSIIEIENPCSVIVQYGGQTPLNLRANSNSGVNTIGTSPDSIDLAEDRERFKVLIESLVLNSH